MKTIKYIFLVFCMVSFMACSVDETDAISNEEALSQETFNSLINNDQAKTTRGMLWGDCELYGVIGTPANFKPSSGPFDELYTIPNGSFSDGIGAVSESKPGDTDYNGGRWHVNTLKSTVDPSIYANVCSADDINPDDFESTSTYFECPLIKYMDN